MSGDVGRIGWVDNESGRGPWPMGAEVVSGFSPISGIDSPKVLQ